MEQFEEMENVRDGPLDLMKKRSLLDDDEEVVLEFGQKGYIE